VTYRRVEQVMGLPISLALRGPHAGGRRADDAWAAAVMFLRGVDRVFSTYREDSCISRLGRGEVGVGDCPPEVAEVLALADAARLASGGAFDVRRTAADGTPVLDTDGVVKGWAIERAAQAFDDLPDIDLCLSGGGDMVCRVADPDGDPWRIGIEDPRHPQRVLAVLPLGNGAVATSGTAHRGHHIVDARTGAHPRGVASVTVVASDLTWADIDATSAFAMGRDALTWLRSRPGRAGVVVWGDGSTDTFATPRERAGSRSH
jgi:thiamine biosynthesis lipoprotein